MRPRSELSTSYSVSGHDASIIIRTIYSKRTNYACEVQKRKEKLWDPLYFKLRDGDGPGPTPQDGGGCEDKGEECDEGHEDGHPQEHRPQIL